MAKDCEPKIFIRFQLVGRLAQLVARVLSMHKVAGSIPAMSKKIATRVVGSIPTLSFAMFYACI